MKLDRLVLTSPETGNIGGLPQVLEKKPVDEVWDVFDPEKFSLGVTYNEFLTNLGDWKLSLTPYDSRTAQMYTDYYEFLKAIKSNANKELPKRHYRAKAGDVIYEEKGLRLSVLWPPAEGFQSSDDILDNNSVVLKLVHGKVSFLFTSNIKRDAEWALIDDKSDAVKSTVLLAPSHGHKYSSTNEFIRAVSPEAVIIQFGYLKGRSFYESDLIPALERYAVCVSSTQSCRTDTSGSVEIVSDGEKYNFSTKLGKTGFGISSAQGETGAGEILNIGIQ